MLLRIPTFMKLIDPESKQEYNCNSPIWISPANNLLSIEFDAAFNLDAIKKKQSNLWRYEDAIAIDQKLGIVSMQEGFTPLEPITINKKKVYIKHEQLFSTGSYKDRGATTLISKVKQLGIDMVIQDSSGNAGCAIAAYAAKAGINCHIYLPENTSPNKIAQMQAYGATIVKVQGNREDTANATLKAAEKTYYASHSYNPWFFEGTKTFAFEICEQQGWKAPDAIVLPAGNGTLVIGCFIGFNQLAKAGIITKIPKIIAIQTQACNPLSIMFHKNLPELPSVESTATYAEGIAIAKPIRAKQIVSSVKETKGTFISVNEEEIKTAWTEMARIGNYIEPTSAATIAGLKQYIKNNDDELVVSLFSGHGLKSKPLF